jgi:hypothetical protein
VKIPAEEPAFALAGCELVRHPTTVTHVARFLPLVRGSAAPYLFVLVFILPFKGTVLHFALAFALPPGAAAARVAEGAATNGGGTGISQATDAKQAPAEANGGMAPWEKALGRCEALRLSEHGAV